MKLRLFVFLALFFSSFLVLAGPSHASYTDAMNACTSEVTIETAQLSETRNGWSCLDHRENSPTSCWIVFHFNYNTGGSFDDPNYYPCSDAAVYTCPISQSLNNLNICVPILVPVDCTSQAPKVQDTDPLSPTYRQCIDPKPPACYDGQPRDVNGQCPPTECWDVDIKLFRVKMCPKSPTCKFEIALLGISTCFMEVAQIPASGAVIGQTICNDGSKVIAPVKCPDGLAGIGSFQCADKNLVEFPLGSKNCVLPKICAPLARDVVTNECAGYSCPPDSATVKWVANGIGGHCVAIDVLPSKDSPAGTEIICKDGSVVIIPYACPVVPEPVGTSIKCSDGTTVVSPAVCPSPVPGLSISCPDGSVVTSPEPCPVAASSPTPPTPSPPTSTPPGGTTGTGYTTAAGCVAGDACDQSKIKFHLSHIDGVLTGTQMQIADILKAIKDFKVCPPDSTAIYCAEFGSDAPVPIQEKIVPVVFEKKITSAGSCPAPFVFDGQRVGYHSVSYQPFCDFAVSIHFFVISIASLSALYIVSSSVRRG